MPNFYNPYQYSPQYGFQTQQAQPIQQIQNGGFLTAPSEEYARNYPVALGNSVTFKDEHAPYVYTKTMGFSQLDSPKFEKYKLIKEDAESPLIAPVEPSQDNKVINDTLDDLKAEIEAVKQDIKSIKEKLKSLKPATKKPVKEEEYDDE